MTLSIADLNNPFCQSDSLDRSTCPLFVEPCEGLDFPPGSLIQLVAPVYGLNDAPRRWHRAWLVGQGCRNALLESCLYVHYAPSGEVDRFFLVELDDLATGIKRLQEAEFQQRFQAAFRFGKWARREASYAGRRVRQRDQYVLVDQETYILEKLHAVLLRGRQQKDRGLTLDEFEQLRSLVDKISWIAKESRPMGSGTASILAQRLKALTVCHRRSSGEMSALIGATVSHSLAARSEGFARDLCWRRWRNRRTSHRERRERAECSSDHDR